MRDIIVHIVAADRLAEHPTCAQHINCTFWNAKKYSAEKEKQFLLSSNDLRLLKTSQITYFKYIKGATSWRALTSETLPRAL